MKHFLILVLSVFLFSLTLATWWWRENSKPLSSQSKPSDFLVVKGKNASQIAESLFEKGLIKSPLAFKIYVQLNGRESEIKAGRYILSPSMSLTEIVEALLKGPKDLWVTIPEGLRKEEVVERIIFSLKNEEPDSFKEEFLVLTKDKEGFLFPDTYLFPRESSAKLVVQTLLNTFNNKIKVFENDINKSELSLKEIVILASIIERETKSEEERPIVAGILLKRLKIGMPLQVDATIQYLLADLRCQGRTNCNNWWPVITNKDLTIDSPYNTYKYKGLPPSPIANPGLSSLEAVIHPKDSEYLYYLHDSQGKIHYARDLKEHNQNVREYLRE